MLAWSPSPSLSMLKEKLYHRQFPVLASIFLLSLLLIFQLRGITYYDEGYILHAALRIFHGQIPYRDFDALYTPLSYLLTAIAFKLFGVSILAERIGAMIISLFSLFALYSILRIITRNVAILFFSLLFYSLWGPAHVNFMWPTMLASCLFLYTMLFYLQGHLKESRRYFYFSGVATVLIFFSKQNFGLAILAIAALLFFFYGKQKYQQLMPFLLGVGTTAFVAIGIMLLTHSFFPFLNDFYFFTIEKILLHSMLNTPFIYGATLPVKLAKLILYLSPLLISLVAWYFSLKKRSILAILPLFVAVFYLAGIRPTTDYDHLVPLLALSVIPLVISLMHLPQKMTMVIPVGILALLSLAGLYTAYFMNYYKWEAPLRENVYFAANPRVNIFLTPSTNTDMVSLGTYIDSKTKPADKIFVNFDASLIYFISQRENASRVDYISADALSTANQRDILQKMQQKEIKMVVMNQLNKSEKSPIAEYVRHHYHIVKMIDDTLIYSL